MANKDDYLTEYREFFEYFAQTFNPHDQLPVKLSIYKLANVEVVGGIIDWTSQYLQQKRCPQCLIAPLIKMVIDEIRKACKKHPIVCGFNPQDNAYEPLKLMQTVMAKTNEICLRYMDNSMLCSLPSPGPPHNVVSVCAVKNTRRRMEDRHVVIHDLNTMFNIQEASPSSYYAIFDGHAGHDAAAYSSAHLHQFLAESKHFVHNPEQALVDAFCKTDALFVDKCQVEKLSSGTTVVCALLRPKEKSLYIAWVGDSQALLASQGRVLQCVLPHKPCRDDERKRIEKQGGVVLYWGTWRVNGHLAVSRAIGDFDYKPYVIATPDIREIPLTGSEDFIILACDGLWDFLSEDEAACTVYDMVCTNPDDTESISQRLVQLAKKQGSSDNISVIVVFLREPSKIAAEAHWPNRNTLTMDAGLDNANATNNPFANSNGTEILSQKDGFLLNLNDGFKQNGSEISPTNDYLFDRSTNGKRSADEFDEDEDMGPETDVDAVDDISLSPSTDVPNPTNDNKHIDAFDPFATDMEEKTDLDLDINIQKQQMNECEPTRSPREETPTPPADEVHDATLEENVGDSGEDSEDEWNYYKGDSAEKESISSSKADREVAELTKTEEEDIDTMSQLNPDAAEFVPISSPTRVSPACRALINDTVIAQSPSRETPSNVDICLPNPQDFEKEVKSRPSDVYSNGHESESGHKLSSQEVMENLLNGKNIEDIEFHPSTPGKQSADEFHFGPNATPFSTPAKPLDQSETALSTKAIFGDESSASYLEGKNLGFDTSFTESGCSNPFGDVQDFQALNKEEQDPMSMSFCLEKNETNPFDLNQVQLLPENIDDFLEKPRDNGLFNETISDLPEHSPLGETVTTITDLDKQTDTIESACPEDSLLQGICKLPKTPEPELQEAFYTLQEHIKETSDIPSGIFGFSPNSVVEAANAPLPKTPEPTEDIPISSPLPPTKDSPISSPLPIKDSPIPSPIPTKDSPIPSPIPTKDNPIPSPIPTKDSPIPSPIPSKDSPILSPIPTKDSPVPSPIPTKDSPISSPVPIDSPSPSPLPSEEICSLKQPEICESGQTVPDDMCQITRTPDLTSPDLANDVNLQSPEPEISRDVISPVDYVGSPDKLEKKLEDYELCDDVRSIPVEPNILAPTDELPILEPGDGLCEMRTKTPVETSEDILPEPSMEVPELEQPTPDVETSEIHERELNDEICQISKSPVIQTEEPTEPVEVSSQFEPIEQFNETVVQQIQQEDLYQLSNKSPVLTPEPFEELLQLSSKSPVAVTPEPTEDISVLSNNLPPEIIQEQSEDICDFSNKFSPIVSPQPAEDFCQLSAKSPTVYTNEDICEIVNKAPALITPEPSECKNQFNDSPIVLTPEPNENLSNACITPPAITPTQPEEEIHHIYTNPLECESSDNLNVAPETQDLSTPSPVDVKPIEESKFPDDAVPETRDLSTPDPIEKSELVDNLNIETKDLSAPVFETLDTPELIQTEEITSDTCQIPIKSEIVHSQESHKPDLSPPSPVEIIETIDDVLEFTTSEQELVVNLNHNELVEDMISKEKMDIESPVDDITSSVKDDLSSPINDDIIEDAKDMASEKEIIKELEIIGDTTTKLEIKPVESNENQPELKTRLNDAQELSYSMQEAIVDDTISSLEEANVQPKETDLSSPKSTTSEQVDTESVATAEISAFLDRSNLPDVTSPLSPNEQQMQEQIAFADLNNPSRCVYPLDTQIVTVVPVESQVKAAEYPEETVLPTSQDVKLERPVTPVESKVAPAALPEVVLEAAEEKSNVANVIETAAAVVGATAAVAAVTATVAATVDKDKKAPKPKSAPLTKKTTPKTTTSPSKPTTPKVTSKTTTNKLPVGSPTKLSTTRPPKPAVSSKPTTPVSKTTATKLTRPRSEPTAKSTDKKPLANGDVKLTPTRTSGTKKTPTTTVNKTLAPVTKTVTAKLSSETKTTTSTRSTVTSKSTVSRTATAPKPRPTTLATKPPSGPTSATRVTSVPATKTTAQPKTTTASSPKAPIAKPRPATVPATRTKLTATKTSSKDPDTEKQIKESVNKQLTTTRTTSSKAKETATSKSTMVRKIEAKVPATTRTITSKTTTNKSMKKPTEITRNVPKTTKTTSTKATKSQQNGLSNGVTTVVKETTTIISTEPQLVKDLSPMENKLILDNSQFPNIAD